MVAATCPFCRSMFTFTWPSDDDDDIDDDAPFRIQCLWCRRVFDPYAKLPPDGDSRHVGIEDLDASDHRDRGR
jgi:hypothetical protein